VRAIGALRRASTDRGDHRVIFKEVRHDVPRGDDAMVPNNMDVLEWLRKHLDAEGSDLLREMVATFAERLMAAEVEVLCTAGYGEVTAERVNSRNGDWSRPLDTRVGSIELAIPKLREGSYYPGWLLEPRRRAERALVAVVAECYVHGVSTSSVEELVQTFGIERLSKSQVSRMAASSTPRWPCSATDPWTPGRTRTCRWTRWPRTCARGDGSSTWRW
jgi:hypothetical protein